MNRLPHPSGSPQDSTTPPARSRQRVAWLDFFRGAAVLVMIETHVVNTFLATTARAESWFAVLNYLNGLVAPSFFFIAGFVQGMERASAPDRPVNVARRARRLLGIGLIGYALHFPWPELAQHRWDAALRVGTQVDVLQCLALSLGVLLLVAWLAQKIGGRRGENFWWCGTVALILFAVLVAPAAATWNSAAIPLRAWLNFSTGSWFPLFPWAGFVFAGALAGAAARLGQKAGDIPAASASTAPLPPIGLSVFSRLRPSTLLITPLPLAISAWAFRGADYSPICPASFLERTAWVFVLAALCEWLATRRRLPGLVLFAGQRSLTLYVAHLVLISTLVALGVPTGAFPVAEVLGLILAVGAVSLVVTWCISRLQVGLFVPATMREPSVPAVAQAP